MKRWLALLCAVAAFGSVHCTKAKKSAKPSTLKRASAFQLPDASGKTVSVGKPWRGWTVLVFFRGDW